MFALEDVNYRLRDYVSGEVIRNDADPLFGLEPLYCLAISAKRYVLFNRITWVGMGAVQTVTVIRKVSGHGLGALRHLDYYIPSLPDPMEPEPVDDPENADVLETLPPMGDYDPTAHPLTAPDHIAAPVDPDTGKRNYAALVHGPSPRMLCDIWRIVIDCFLEGKQGEIDKIISSLPQLQVPQYTQLTLSTPHLMNLYPRLPGRRGFQFFATFPKPKCEVDSRYVRDVPFDEHKALCKATLYASVPAEGLMPELIEEWKTTETGLFRRDNNEFPHGLFNPAWRLRLQTVADKLRGYFYHEEIKSSGGVGQLRPKVVVSLDKHFIGKETSSLDDDSEDTQDDVPLTTSSDLVLRSVNRNLQPVMDIEDEEAVLAGAFLKLKKGKNLTFDDMKELKDNLEVNGDGVLRPRYLKMETEALTAADSMWAFRIKTWERLKKFGGFEDISKLANVPVDDLDFAARYGDYQWYGGSNGAENIKCENLDWGAVASAIDDLSGRTQRLNEQKGVRRKAAERASKQRANQKVSALLTEVQAADFIVFPTDILRPSPIDEAPDDVEYNSADEIGIVSHLRRLNFGAWKLASREQGTLRGRE